VGEVMHRFGRRALFVAGGAALVVVLIGWAVSALLSRRRTEQTAQEPVPVRAAA
jgi:hypothetical protein